MDSREYLNYVLDKLQERIRKLDDAYVPHVWESSD